MIIKIDKERAIKEFFNAYTDIESAMEGMSPEQLMEFLENDIFIGIASATTGIPEGDFMAYAPIYFS